MGAFARELAIKQVLVGTLNRIYLHVTFSKRPMCVHYIPRVCALCL